MPCDFPGCVLLTDGESKWCPVHRDSVQGKRCEACHGTGSVMRQGDGAKYLKSACDRCGGVGLRDAHRSTVIPKKDRVPVDDRDLLKKMR